jgi:hypothetical protein
MAAISAGGAVTMRTHRDEPLRRLDEDLEVGCR